MLRDKKVIVSMRAHSAAIMVSLITIVCLVPFANKAFHIDDPLFLWTAKQIQTKPTDFYGFSVNWFGKDEPMSEVNQNPPGAAYYIALVALLFGWSEITMHIAFLVPAVAAALGTYYLAENLCSRPALAALAAVLTPAFLVSSTNVMCDTMMLALWVWAVFFWVRAIKVNDYLKLFIASMLVTICALMKYYGMSLLPLLFVYSLMQKRRFGVWALFLLVPVIFLTGYQWFTHNLYGFGLLSDAAAYATDYSRDRGSTFLLRGLTGLAFTGGCILTVLFYSPLLWSKRVLISSIVVMILFILALSFVETIGNTSLRNDTGVRWNYLIQAGLMAAAGVGVLGLAIKDFWKFRNAESLLLLLWVLGTFIFAGFVNWTVNARSILPMAPAVGILLIRQIDRRTSGTVRRVRTWRTAWPLAPAAAVALLVCWADYTLANTARLAAEVIHKEFRHGQQTLWFQGHWGFQYYMETGSARALDLESPEAVQADIVITPSNNCNIRSFPKEEVYFMKAFKLTPFRRIAIMSRKEIGAGFYSDVWGPLPFVVGAVKPEMYYVFVVK